MHDEAIKTAQKEETQADRQAYFRLGTRRRKLAFEIAAFAATNRGSAMTVFGGLIKAAEIAVNVLLVWPYKKIWQGLSFIANKSVAVLKLPVRAITGAARSALALARGGIITASGVTKLLGTSHAIAETTQTRWLSSLDAGYRTLQGYSNSVIQWGQRVRSDVDAGWVRLKTGTKKFLHKSAEIFEVYGAIGLYRASKWAMNPRTPSGKPLLGNEAINKTFGMALGIGTFAAFAGGLTYIGALAKIWHIDLAVSFATDSGPLWLKMGKQALLHPLITGGLTAAKFVALPVIAATRQALKSSDFTKGIAYAYNSALREKDRRRRVLRRAPAPNAVSRVAACIKARVFKNGALRTMFNNQSLNFIGKFMEHVVEKASPAHYETRIKHYRKRADYSSYLS